MSQHLGQNAKWESGMPAFFYRQFFEHPPKPPSDPTHLKDQTAIVTGSNGGLGLETARQLLRLGLSRLILAVRSQEKGDAAAASLRAEFPSRSIDVWLLDMESYASITAFAKRCEHDLNQLDIAILNAGVQKTTFVASKDTGHEMDLQVNYLSTAMLAILLLPIMKDKKQVGKAGRLAIVSSDTGYWSDLNHKAGEFLAGGPILPQLDKPEGYSTARGYWRSKTLLTAFVAKLADNVDPDDVIVNSVNPGLTGSTNLQREHQLGVVARTIVNGLMAITARSVEVGASTNVDAVVRQGKESHGSYVSDWTIKPYPLISYSDEGKAFIARLWEETMEELNFARASEILTRLK
ncbi:hypothetical protein B0H66DRAFT_272399 [Apodospora peruviana]|uniref:Short-chain dehydrogenase/reductase family protein n=1 Tax=Apodospora peruviana TaxID=516989 RepID=A0AAE0HZL5_9PEZI|nr:hypothetical protein B0H66DRAFT_272399 [Apodospora peruviana]